MVHAVYQFSALNFVPQSQFVCFWPFTKKTPKLVKKVILNTFNCILTKNKLNGELV